VTEVDLDRFSLDKAQRRPDRAHSRGIPRPAPRPAPIAVTCEEGIQGESSAAFDDVEHEDIDDGQPDKIDDGITLNITLVVVVLIAVVVLVADEFRKSAK
jgi:hypothetical protein